MYIVYVHHLSGGGSCNRVRVHIVSVHHLSGGGNHVIEYGCILCMSFNLVGVDHVIV